MRFVHFATARYAAVRYATVVIAAGVALSACGSDDGTGTTPTTQPLPTVTADAALAAMVPDAIKADGKITAGVEATYPPAEFLAEDGKTVIGFDPDLFKAVAAKLGLTVEFQQSTFGDIIPGVGTGKYEAGVSAFTINKDRIQQANMVSYFNAGTQWATKKGNPAGVSIDEPCGKRIAVQKDTVQVDDITVRSTACTSAGKPAVTIDPYPGQDAAANAVVSGKDDAMLADSPVIAYAVQQSNGQLEKLGDIYDSAPYGYVVKKSDMQFAQAIQKATQALIDDGSYKKILDAWNVGDGAIKTSEINPA